MLTNEEFENILTAIATGGLDDVTMLEHLTSLRGYRAAVDEAIANAETAYEALRVASVSNFINNGVNVIEDAQAASETPLQAGAEPEIVDESDEVVITEEDIFEEILEEGNVI